MNFMSDFYFFDTYALIEIIKGNENYKKYLKSRFLVTKLNLFELHYTLLREFDEELADKILSKLESFAIDFDETIISYASKFRYAHKSRKLSMTDCIGYAISIKYDVPFLTGDNQFFDLPNVEFMK